MPAHPPDPATPAAALVVLDTNVVLDLWLFGDARAQPLRPFAADWPAPPAQVLATVHASARLVQQPAAGPPAPRCTDTDDQKFIDLAWAWPASVLFSRDRAVLKLARAAQRRSLQITTPERWAQQQAGA